MIPFAASLFIKATAVMVVALAAVRIAPRSRASA